MSDNEGSASKRSRKGKRVMNPDDDDTQFSNDSLSMYCNYMEHVLQGDEGSFEDFLRRQEHGFHNFALIRNPVQELPIADSLPVWTKKLLGGQSLTEADVVSGILEITAFRMPPAEWHDKKAKMKLTDLKHQDWDVVMAYQGEEPSRNYFIADGWENIVREHNLKPGDNMRFYEPVNGGDPSQHFVIEFYKKENMLQGNPDDAAGPQYGEMGDFLVLRENKFPELTTPDIDPVDEFFLDLEMEMEMELDMDLIDVALLEFNRHHELTNLRMHMEEEDVYDRDTLINESTLQSTMGEFERELAAGENEASTVQQRLGLNISKDEVVANLDLKMSDAADKLRVSPRTLRSICRAYGISKWPSHKKK